MKLNKLYTYTHYITYLTFIHGLIYLIIKFFLKVETEYGLRPHFLQSYLQAIHILLSPLLIFIFGALFKEHIVKMYYSAKRKRKTGIALFISMIIMIISGYLVQIIYSENPKLIASYTHIGISFLFIFSYLIHHIQKSK